VTYIATYLSTTLPNQMQVNDLNHELQVENQVGNLQADLVVATESDAVGAQLSQPISLGSAGAPPFAAQDSGWTSALPQGSGMGVTYKALGTNGSVSIAIGPAPGAGFAAHLRNTYAPSAEVAFDQGAVVFAQSGGTPIFVDAPQIQLTTLNATHGAKSWENVTQVSIWVPEFVGHVPGDSGISPADISFQLLAIQPATISAATGLSTSTPINFTITSPYAAAWMTFVNQHSWPFTATCTPITPATTAVCVGPYIYNVGLGKVTFSVPATNLHTLTVVTAVFAVSQI